MNHFHPPTRNSLVLAAGVFLLLVVAFGAYFAGLGTVPTAQTQRDKPDAAGDDGASRIQRYRDHLAETPGDHAARLKLAELLKPIDAKSALEEFRHIPREAAEYPQAILHIAHIATVGRQNDLAEEALRTLNELRPNDLGVVLSLAELYYRTERHAEALLWAEQAADLAPQRARTWLLIAELLDRLNRPGEMLKTLRKAIELDPALYPAHANLVYALQFAGEPEAAEREARWCLERQPNDTAVRRWLAMALRDQGEHDAALAEIRKALAIDPEDVDCRIVEADLLLFRREAEEAYIALKPFYPAQAHRRDFLGSLARAAALSGRREESRRYQREITDLIKDQSEDHPSNAAQLGGSDPS